MDEKSGGMGVLTALGLIFITLKLTGVVGWSWWWVLAPFWIPGALGLLIFLIAAIVMVAIKVGRP